LRTRSEEEKARIVDAFLKRFGKALESGAIRPTIDCVMPMAQAADAHRRMQASTHFGKIVLRVD
jgi:NADPH:quinone reductase